MVVKEDHERPTSAVLVGAWGVRAAVGIGGVQKVVWEPVRATLPPLRTVRVIWEGGRRGVGKAVRPLHEGTGR